jgi:hypothetical protein
MIEVPIPLRPARAETPRDRGVIDMELGPEGSGGSMAVVPVQVRETTEPASIETEHASAVPDKERLAQAERLTMVARAVAVIATTITSGWLIYLSLMALLESDPPYAPVIFCAMLVFGLLSASRQMLNGPASVHVAAATAIMLCMPLTITMGLPVVDLQKLAKETTVDDKPLALEMAQTLVLLNFSVIGCVFSLPVWFAALRITLLKRLKKKWQ